MPPTVSSRVLFSNPRNDDVSPVFYATPSASIVQTIDIKYTHAVLDHLCPDPMTESICDDGRHAGSGPRAFPLDARQPPCGPAIARPIIATTGKPNAKAAKNAPHQRRVRVVFPLEIAEVRPDLIECQSADCGNRRWSAVAAPFVRRAFDVGEGEAGCAIQSRVPRYLDRTRNMSGSTRE